jgi:prolyl 4-hydroxylase
MQVHDPLAALPVHDALTAARLSAGRWRLPWVRVVDGFLDDDASDALRERITALAPAAAPVTTFRGAVMRPDIRNNERVIFDDVELAAQLFERARPFLPPQLRGEPRTTQTEGDVWLAHGLNERFRGYRYQPGQRFAPHHDGCFRRTDDEQSAITFLVYLDGGCVGGETRLLDWDVTVRPQRGMCLVFDHYMLHEGAVVQSGLKHVLRSDVMYRRVA